jgi:hypothetical protein
MIYSLAGIFAFIVAIFGFLLVAAYLGIGIDDGLD